MTTKMPEDHPAWPATANDAVPERTMTPEQLREWEGVPRWTSAAVSPDRRGGFVAYGDYLTLLRAHAAALEDCRVGMQAAILQRDQERAKHGAALAEAERKCERLKFHAEAMREILLAQLVNQGSHLYEWREETEVALASHRAEFKEDKP